MFYAQFHEVLVTLNESCKRCKQYFCVACFRQMVSNLGRTMLRQNQTRRLQVVVAAKLVVAVRLD